MSKRFLIILTALTALTIGVRHVFLSTDASDNPTYARFIGKTLITLKDLYLVRFDGAAVESLGDAECISSVLPHPPGPSFIGGRHGGIEITKFVPSGSSVKISKVKKNVNTAAEFSGQIEGSEEEIDLSFTQDYGGDMGLLKKGFYNTTQL
jgi:hypothetical protein